jgi:hypothetical protein
MIEGSFLIDSIATSALQSVIETDEWRWHAAHKGPKTYG